MNVIKMYTHYNELRKKMSNDQFSRYLRFSIKTSLNGYSLFTSLVNEAQIRHVYIITMFLTR